MSVLHRRFIRRWVAAGALFCGLATGCSQLPKLPELPTPKNLAKKAEQTMSLARLCEGRGQLGEARHMYEGMIKKNPKNRLAHHRLAIVLTQQGKFAEADQQFNAAWELGPPTSQLLSDMGYRLYLEHRLEDAERVLHQALDIEPHHAAATNNLGLVLGQQGKYRDALTMFRKVNPEAQAEANLAYVLALCGDTKAAQVHYGKSLSLNETMRTGDKSLRDPKMRAAADALLELAARDGVKPIPSPPRPYRPFAPDAPVPPGDMQAQQPAAVPPNAPATNFFANQNPSSVGPMAVQPGQPPITSGLPAPGPAAGMPMSAPNGPIALTSYTIPAGSSSSTPNYGQYPGSVPAPPPAQPAGR